MTKQKSPEVDTSEIARSKFAKMTDEERRALQAKVRKAVHQRDLMKFREALAKLGYDEASAEYEKLMQLWDEFGQASRHAR